VWGLASFAFGAIDDELPNTKRPVVHSCLKNTFE